MLIQIIDVSDRMLYNEVKAEKKFKHIINSAISDDLKNPLEMFQTEIQTINEKA